MSYVKYLRTLILGLGVISAWSALIAQFLAFYAAYGTFMHLSTASASNPFLTPCLYGSLAFLVALLWSSMLSIAPSERSDVWLQRFLVFGIVFAGVVVAYECGEYFHLFRVGVPLVCSEGVNPLYTACFRGLIFFILAYLAGIWSRRTSSSAIS